MEQKESKRCHNKCYEVQDKHLIRLFNRFWELMSESWLKFIKSIINAIEVVEWSIECDVYFTKNLSYLIELVFSLDDDF